MLNNAATFRAILVAAALAMLAVPLRADLVYNTETGRWTIDGGALEPYLGNVLNAKSAIEAMDFAAQAQEEEKYRSALSLYEQVYEDYPNDLLAPEALYQSAAIYRQRHQFDKAFEHLNRIVDEYPGYEKYNQVVALQFQIAEAMAKGERPRYWGVIPGFKDYDTAMEYFDEVVANGPYTDYASLALMRKATLAEQEEDYEVAIDALDRLINYYPDSILAPDAYLKLGSIFQSLVDGPEYDQGSTREAIAYYQDFIALYPDSPLIAEAEQGLAEMRNMLSQSRFDMGNFYYLYRNDTRAATVFYNEAITVAPDSKSAEEARAQLAKIEQGIAPPKTPVDRIFGRYKDPSIREMAEDAAVESRRGIDTDESGLFPEKGDLTDEEDLTEIPEDDTDTAPRDIPVEVDDSPNTHEYRGGARRL